MIPSSNLPDQSPPPPPNLATAEPPCNIELYPDLVAWNAMLMPPITWCENTERIAVAMNDMAQINHKFCMYARVFYGKCSVACSFPVSLGGSLLATMVAVLQQDPPVLPPNRLRLAMYALAFLGLLMTLLRIVQSVFQIDDRCTQFEMAARGWERFATRVTFELAKLREFRMNAKLFLGAFGKELEELETLTPVVPPFIVRRVVLRYRRDPRERAKFDAMFKPFAYRNVFSTAKLMRVFTASSSSSSSSSQRVVAMSTTTPGNRSGTTADSSWVGGEISPTFADAECGDGGGGDARRKSGIWQWMLDVVVPGRRDNDNDDDSSPSSAPVSFAV